MPISAASSARTRSANGAVEFSPERQDDGRLVDALIDRAFGPGRFAKTAERLREGNRSRRELSVCAWSDGTLVGAVRLWPVLIGARRAAFLGPIAVEQAWRKQGLGGALVERACAAARQAGEDTVLLVGDVPFFGPLGFQVAPVDVVLPGPVDRRRLLWRALQPGLETISGPVCVPRDA